MQGNNRPVDPDVTRRSYLTASAAGLLGMAGLSGSVSAQDLSDATSALAAQTSAPEDPEIPDKGYLVAALGDGIYWITEGVYQMLFLTTGEGVVVVDAPPTIGQNILAAIDEVTDEPITHVVYSHYHADHIGAATLYPDDAEYIAHVGTARFLDRVGDDNRPSPTTVFGPRTNATPSTAGQQERPDRRHVDGNSYTLEVGDQRLELEHRGPNHAAGNVFIHAPTHRVLMFVDVVFPRWIPFQNLAESSDIPGYIRAHDQILEYDFDTLVAGHLTRLGTPADVRTQREFVTDLEANCREAIATVDLGQVVQERQPTNLWETFAAYLDETSRVAADATLETWGNDRLRGADVFMQSHAATMIESLRIDFGVLGPFGL
ncbi:MBL fold metallo-hydrolase [Haloarcula pellucida]|uniref:MBL fold metallo-hydrolase n=1 Tax=Haloarcula pellucida TaxID=1427151 RepID=A0A830GP66_9EURY|nr:MBL fold metallo-hydrolase [Halomicroarcula pellucida]MBX0348060.1 MBL fold metallo-hydrolase [Halomicroarcula pellucida]GGN96719.1 MBL fold metallo-hydrolase [Halomicroarcula pellucida]